MTTDTRRRVKLYALNAERQWDDRGTGHVSSNYVDRLKGISLLVRAESDGSLLLESKIQPDTAYQKQQDTLIVWSEGDNFDLALSFQEKAGCDEIWEKICQVQGKDPSVEITQDIVEESEDERFEDMSDTAPPIELPPCELARLEDISETIQNCLTTQLRKEKLSMALETDSYIKKLLNLFHVCEDLEIVEGLHHLFEIFKNIFLLNKNALFEIMFAEDTIFDVVGCLEYDPSATQPKKHRQYLKQLAKFREAVPIKNQDLLAKIHQTFRVQYIQDIILPTPSVFVEDNMLNTLSSFIFFNKVEIVTLIQEDERFLVDMFTLLTDQNTSDAKRRDIVLFLKEFCNYAQNLQPQGKDSFYKTLTCLGILQALEITLPMNDQKTKAASIDILTAIVEFSPLVVRNYTLQQANRTESDRMLLNIAIEQMLTDSEPELGVAVQLMGIIKILLEPENMLTEKGDFLNFFYKHSIQTLIAPLLLNTLGDRPTTEDYQTAQLLGIVLDILSFCVEHHTYHIKNFIIQKDLLKRILVLMKSTHTFLVLGALRLLRKIIALKDEFYNRHIIKGNLFAPVVDAFIRNNGRYNLLESAILELFEFVKLEDIKTLCVYFVENFSKIFDEIEYVQTFKYLKNRYDQYQDRLKDRDKMSLDPPISTSIPIIRSGRFRRDTRQMEEEEEMWFNEEEDFAEELDTYNTVMKPVSPNGPSPCALQCQQKSPPHTALNQSQLPQTATTSVLTPADNNTSMIETEENIDTENIDPATSSNPNSLLEGDQSTQQQTVETAAHLGAAAVVVTLSQQSHQQHQQQQREETQESQQNTVNNYQSHSSQSQLNLVAAAAAVVAANDRLTESETQRKTEQNLEERLTALAEVEQQQQNDVQHNEMKATIINETDTVTTSSSTTEETDAYSDEAVAAQLLTSIASSNNNISIICNSNSTSSNNSIATAASVVSVTTTTTTTITEISSVNSETQETTKSQNIVETATTTTTNSSGNSSSNNSSCSSEQQSDSSNDSDSNNVQVNSAATPTIAAVPVAVVGHKETCATSHAALKEIVLKKGLVDYESDSGEEYEYGDEDDAAPQEKKARMA